VLDISVYAKYLRLDLRVVCSGSVVGFNVNASATTTDLAKSLRVDILSFNVIYHLVHRLKESIIKLLPKVKDYNIQGKYFP